VSLASRLVGHGGRLKAARGVPSASGGNDARVEKNWDIVTASEALPEETGSTRKAGPKSQASFLDPAGRAEGR
jgi:hypothetical protein